MFRLNEYTQFEAIGLLSVPLDIRPSDSLDKAKNKYKSQNNYKETAKQKGLEKGLSGEALQKYIEKSVSPLAERPLIQLGRIPFLTRTECHRIIMRSELPPKPSLDSIYLLFNEQKHEFTAYWADEDKCSPHRIDEQPKIEELENFFQLGKTIQINQPDFHIIKSLCGYTPPNLLTLWYRDAGNASCSLQIENKPEWQLVFTDELQLKSIYDLPQALNERIKDLHKIQKYHTVTKFADEALRLSQEAHNLRIYYASSQEEAKKLGRKNPDSPIIFEHKNKFILRGYVNRKWQPQEIKNWEELKEGLDLKSNLVTVKEWTKFHRYVVEQQLHISHSIDYPSYVLFNKALMLKLLSKYKSHQVTLDVALGKEFDDFSFHVHRYALCLNPADLKDQNERIFIAPEKQREKLYNAYLFILFSYAEIIKNNAINHTGDRDEKDLKPNKDKGTTAHFEESHMLPANSTGQAIANARAIREKRTVALSSSIDGDEGQQKLLFTEVETKSASETSKAVYYDKCLGQSKDIAAKHGCIARTVAFVSEKKYSFTQIPQDTKDTYPFQIYNSQDDIKTVQPNIFYVKATTDQGLEYMVKDPSEFLVNDVIPISLIPNLPGTLTTVNISTYWPAIREIVRQRGQIAMELTSRGHIFYSLWQNQKGEHFIHHLESMIIGKVEGNYKLKDWTPIYSQGKGVNKYILCYTKLGSILDSSVMEPLAAELVLR